MPKGLIHIATFHVGIKIIRLLLEILLLLLLLLLMRCLLNLCWWWLEIKFCISILIVWDELLVRIRRIIIHANIIIIYLILFRCEILSHMITHWVLNWMRWWCSGWFIIISFAIRNSLRRPSISIVIVIVIVWR